MWWYFKAGSAAQAVLVYLNCYYACVMLVAVVVIFVVPILVFVVS